jgi:hypothetical protein
MLALAPRLSCQDPLEPLRIIGTSASELKKLRNASTKFLEICPLVFKNQSVSFTYLGLELADDLHRHQSRPRNVRGAFFIRGELQPIV